ncbi:MAG: demethoxyubiquinone hydroxylase family protein [Alphaproteobacteria bacterium]|nr:demethoxyubiquinone hydroxylase family protein [Alphaproteobacteria bacterium]
MAPHKEASKILKEMIRVDQAGEYGALRIYQGQLDALGQNHPIAPTIEHMYVQEKRHLETFNHLVVKHRVRPTVLSPLWHVAGYCLGYATGLLGEKAAMACTVAVESVIDDHYAEQEKMLETINPEIKAIVSEFRLEEIDHKNIGLANDAEQAPAYMILTGAIKSASKLAIWLSKRV